MNKIVKVLFWIELITGLLLIIIGAILFIGISSKNVSHFLLIAGLIQLIIAFVILILGRKYWQKQ